MNAVNVTKLGCSNYICPMCLTSLKIIKISILKNNCFKIAKQHFPVCIPCV